MFSQDVNISNIIKELKINNLDSYYFLDEMIIEYYLEYNYQSAFIDRSFIIRNNENILLCPITIEQKKNSKYLNFFGNPFFCIYLNKDENFFIHFKEKIKEIFESEKIDNIDFIIEKNCTNLLYENNVVLNQDLFKKISNTKYINLNLSDEEIRKNFSKGLKHVLSKDHESLSYLIIDKENYNKEILEMKKMHKEIAQKSTRSNESWLCNEKMILSGKGFLVQVSDGSKVISYSLFFNNGKESCYFSSCTYRNLFKIYKNINHKSIFEAIKYLREKNCYKLTLGETKIIHCNEIISDKEKNICTFKSAFGGDKFTHYYLDKRNLDFIDLYLK